MDSRAYSWLLFTPALGLWSAALFQPALRHPGPPGSFQYSGLHCLLLGWIGAFGKPQFILPWASNVIFWAGMGAGIFRRQPGRGILIWSLVAIPLALVALTNRTIEMDESGQRTDVVPGLGFYLWLASMVALAAALFVRAERPL
jgi:hypothetical protein